MDALIQRIATVERKEKETADDKNLLHRAVAAAIKDCMIESIRRNEDLDNAMAAFQRREDSMNTSTENLKSKVKSNTDEVERLSRQVRCLTEALKEKTDQREMRSAISMLQQRDEILEKKHNKVLGEISASQEQIANVYDTFQTIQKQFETLSMTIKSIESRFVESAKSSRAEREPLPAKIVEQFPHTPPPYKLLEASYIDQKKLEVGAALQEINNLQKVFSRRRWKGH